MYIRDMKTTFTNENGAFNGEVKCRECGETNESWKAFCWRCGAEVEE